MKNKLKIPLSKISGLFGINGVFHHRRWPLRVLDTLELKYHLRPEDMLRLWYIRRKTASGKFNQGSIFIFDWVKARERNISIRKEKDLYNNTDLIIFKGNVFRDGTVHVRSVGNFHHN